MFDTTTQKLKEAGLDNPRAEARYLIMAVCGVDPLLQEFSFTENLQKALEQRCARVPLAKIIGRKEFYGRNFIVNTHVLDPRPDSEAIVEAALLHIKNGDVIYDLGTGSGCLLLTLLAETKNTRGIGVDISSEALTVAQTNAMHLGLETRALFINDTFETFAPSQKANLVISNPPYIKTADIARLAPEVKHHDPMLALDGGEDGLEPYHIILSRMSQILLPKGLFLLEFSDELCNKVQSLAREYGHEPIIIIYDLAGHRRGLIGLCKQA